MLLLGANTLPAVILGTALFAQDTPPPSPEGGAPADAATPAPATLTPAQLHARERNVLLWVQTIQLAQRTYAASNGTYFDTLRCLALPWECIPGYPADGASFIDPTYNWLEPQLGHMRRFHPGPAVPAEAIARANASPSSLRAYAFTVAPEQPGVSGLRAFCGDSSGRLCMSEDGREPPVKNGQCEPCRKLQ